jgi:hypothetical protein
LLEKVEALLTRHVDRELKEQGAYDIKHRVAERSTSSQLHKDFQRLLVQSCSRYAVDWFFQSLSTSNDLKIHQFQRATYNRIKGKTEEQLAYLPSDESCLKDLPDRLTRLAEWDDGAIFVAFNMPADADFIPSHADILVYSPRYLEFDCTCGLPGLRGALCAHFARAFNIIDSVYYHHKMWHPRWFKDATPIEEKVVAVNWYGEYINVCEF